MIKVGDKVEHILSHSWLLVVDISGDILYCRTKDLDVIEIYDWEVTKVK